MEQAIFTTLCMICADKGQVLVQERMGTAWDGIAFPGGHVEKGEAFTQSVIREVFEETGYIIEAPVLCGIKQFQTSNNARYVIFLYKANQYKGRLQSSTEGRVFWIEKEKLKEYPLAHDLDKMIKMFDDDRVTEFYYTSDSNNDTYVIY